MQRLVILTSGWGKVDLGWGQIRNRFMDHGFDVVHASYPARGWQPIEETALATNEMINAVAPEYEHVTLIGHSMGGLIGRYVVQELKNTNIDAFISLGTPHFGSYLSYLAPNSASACQMRPNSGFLQALNALEWPDIPVLTIRGNLDYIVVPARNTKLPFGETVNIPVATHAGLLIHPRAYWEMYSWLNFSVLGLPVHEDRTTYSSVVRLPSLAQGVGFLGTALEQVRTQLGRLPQRLLRRPDVESEPAAA